MGKTIRITPRNIGDFTNQLPRIPRKTSVFIEGPYGTFTLPQARHKKLSFIAGGIGITPIRSLVVTQRTKEIKE